MAVPLDPRHPNELDGVPVTTSSSAPGQALEPASSGSGLEASTWGALMGLAVLLFVAGVYLGLGVSGVVPSAIGHSEVAYAVPFLLTVLGGALLVHAYENWYQHPDGPGGRAKRRDRLRNLPSFQVHPPRTKGDR